MTVLPFPAPALFFVEQFRREWRAGDFVGCAVGASFDCREVQNECIEAAVEMKREALEKGTATEVIREMDVAIRFMGKNAAAAQTKAEREQMAALMRAF